VLRGSLPARIIRRLNPALLKAILRRWAGLAAAGGEALAGARPPIAFALDRAALRTLGEATLATLDDFGARPPPGDPSSPAAGSTG